MRLLLGLTLLIALGCSSMPKVIDGTNLSLGAYLPYDGGIYGLNVVEYTSGCVIKSLPTNGQWEVKRTYSATNTWLYGLGKTVESTSLEAKGKN